MSHPDGRDIICACIACYVTALVIIAAATDAGSVMMHAVSLVGITRHGISLPGIGYNLAAPDVISADGGSKLCTTAAAYCDD